MHTAYFIYSIPQLQMLQVVLTNYTIMLPLVMTQEHIQRNDSHVKRFLETEFVHIWVVAVSLVLQQAYFQKSSLLLSSSESSSSLVVLKNSLKFLHGRKIIIVSCPCSLFSLTIDFSPSSPESTTDSAKFQLDFQPTASMPN